MLKSGKVFLSMIFVLAFAAGGSGVIFGAAKPAQTLNLPDVDTNAVADDTDAPEITARVARISFIRGDVQIRRTDSQDWEKATLNLPIVEGDELATSGGARLEIQFDNFSHLRLDQNSFLKIAVLKSEGIAVSISQGTMNLRVTDLDKAAGYFEIDAPKTTVAVERSGTYRIDAGKAGDTDLRVSATGGGEARVYSDNAGFTLKSGRSAHVFTEGDTAGEWETAEAVRFTDEFDNWATDRDSTIAARLRDAYYDTYYDNDIYGADDLNGYGEWIHTASYGYIWRPSQNSINSYADWSPYRYGHWRWVPPYGWTWVNDEPWGWATYHHGRWVYDNGYWAWTPYGYYRPARSWWFPALVVINVFNDNVCWYPLGYHHRYYNYNDHHRRRDDDDHQGRIRPTPTRTPPVTPPGGIRPTRTPIGPPIVVTGTAIAKATDIDRERFDRVPPTGVVTTDSRDFGAKTRGIRTAPPEVANAILAKTPNEGSRLDLPEYKQMTGRISREIMTDRPRGDDGVRQIKMGAVQRKSDAPLGQELRTTRIFGGRPPVRAHDDKSGIKTTDNEPTGVRSTGAVARPPIRDRGDQQKQTIVQRDKPPQRDADPGSDSPPTRQPPRFEPPQREIKPREDTPPTRQPPRFEPPQREIKPREDTPPTRQPPRSEPPQREVKPRSEPLPPQEQPKPRNDPPPPKSEPKKETDSPKRLKDSETD